MLSQHRRRLQGASSTQGLQIHTGKLANHRKLLHGLDKDGSFFISLSEFVQTNQWYRYQQSWRLIIFINWNSFDHYIQNVSCFDLSDLTFSYISCYWLISVVSAGIGWIVLGSFEFDMMCVEGPESRDIPDLCLNNSNQILADRVWVEILKLIPLWHRAPAPQTWTQMTGYWTQNQFSYQ